MKKLNASILTKLNESDDSHVNLDKLKELREYLDNIISGMEEKGMAEAHCDYYLPSVDCLSIPGKGYIALTSDTDQDYYFEDLMESAEDDKYEVAGFDKYDELSRLHEDDLKNKVQIFNDILGDWDFIGEPTNPYISSVSISGDNVSIGIELWDPDLDDYVSVVGGTYNCPEFVSKLRDTDLNNTYDLYDDCRALLDILTTTLDWKKAQKKLYNQLKVERKYAGLEEGCKPKKKRRTVKEDSYEDIRLGAAQQEEEILQKVKRYILDDSHRIEEFTDTEVTGDNLEYLNGLVDRVLHYMQQTKGQGIIDRMYRELTNDIIDLTEYTKYSWSYEDPDDPNWYCPICGKKKEEYEARYCNSCWEKIQRGELKESEETKESSVGKEFDSLFDLRSYEGPWEEAVVVFTPDSFKKDYTEEERSYKVFHSAKYFNPDMIGSSLPGYCLDGKDNGVRLDWYTYKQPGFEPWKVEKIYITK